MTTGRRPSAEAIDARTAASWLPFITLTVSSGMVDAVSFLRLGHVFVANMTGNVVFIGFALGGERSISIAGSLIAMGAFLLGAFGGGHLIRRTSENPRLLLRAALVEVLLVLVALAVVSAFPVQPGTPVAYVVTVLLACAMGLQTAAVRKIAVPDFTTTVLTMTLAGIAADDWSGGDARLARRVISVLAMFAGALVGAIIVLRSGLVPVLAVIALLFAATAALLRTSPAPAQR